MISLRERALLGGLASAAVSVGIGMLALYSYTDRQVLEQFDKSLTDRHTQLVVALNATTQDPDELAFLLFDPGYTTPYSGHYWQITRVDDGVQFTSESLFDEMLPEPRNTGNRLFIWDILGDDKSGVRGAYQQITFEDGSEWKVTVAESLDELAARRNELRHSLVLIFALIAVIGLAGSSILTTAVLGPLNKLRDDVAARWEEDEELHPDDYPEEVAPLVSDINQLLHRNREIVSSARRQAADMAHALKTPTAILRNELATLASEGAATQPAEEALSRTEAQLNRSLARMRAANTAELSHSRTDLSLSIDRLSRLFSQMAERSGKALVTQNRPNLLVRMDMQDIEEVIGNLLDNALKWCRGTVRLSARKTPEHTEIVIEDDGPGIPEQSVRDALRSGGRLDTSKPGTGLGLAIATDLLAAYGADLVLEQSPSLGGLCAVVRLPAALNAKKI